MPTKQTLYPTSDLAGDHQLTAPSAFDGSGYTEPTIKAAEAAAYTLGDESSDDFVGGMFRLPSIPGLSGDIQPVGFSTLPYTSAAAATGTSFTLTYPTISAANGGAIQAGDLIEVYCMTVEQAILDRGAAPTPAGFTARYSHWNGEDYNPRQTKFYKVAAGGESGSITVDYGVQTRMNGCVIVWRGVDQSQPYDVKEISDFGHANPDPPSIATLTDGAKIVTIASGEYPGGRAGDTPIGYTNVVNDSSNARAFIVGQRTQGTAGFVDPGIFRWTAANSTVVTDVLRPAGAEATIVIIAGSADGTASGSGVNAPSIGAVNEIQVITSTLTSGTFTLSFQGETTAAIPFNATPSDIASALGGLTAVALPVSTQFAPSTDAGGGNIGEWNQETSSVTGSVVVDGTGAVISAGPDAAGNNFGRLVYYVNDRNNGADGTGNWLVDIDLELPSDFYTNQEGFFRLFATDNYTDGSYDSWRVSFYCDTGGNWQLASEHANGNEWIGLWSGTSADLAAGAAHNISIQFSPGAAGVGSWDLTIDNVQKGGATGVKTLPTTVPSGQQFFNSVTVGVDSAGEQDTLQLELTVTRIDFVADGDLIVSGTTLSSAPMQVEFVGQYENQIVPVMTSSNFAEVQVSKGSVGSGNETFTKIGDINIARAGGSFTPQATVWKLDTASYVAGKQIDVSVSTVASNIKTWAAVLLVLGDEVDSTNPIVFGGSNETGSGQSGGFGAMTPTVAGSKALAIMMKALAAGDYSAAQVTSTPAGYQRVLSAVGDSMTMDVNLSPPLQDTAETTPDVTWPLTEQYASRTVELQPETPMTVLPSLANALAGGTETTWIEIANAAGNMYEVLEVSLSGIPTDAVITGAQIQFAHESGVRNGIRAMVAAINDDDSFVLSDEDQIGYIPEPLGSTQVSTTTVKDEFTDGSRINEYDRLGVVFRSTSAAANLASHRIFWARMVVEYEEGGPVVSSVVGPDADGDPVTWQYTSSGQFIQVGHEVKFIQGSGGDPETAVLASDTLNPGAGEVFYETGLVPSPDARSFTVADHPMSRGNCTVAVRAWARLPNGITVASDWATDNFNISGSGPSAPSGVTAALDEDTGMVKIDGTAPASVSRAWIQTSSDGGTTWVLNPVPFDIAASSAFSIYDPGPLQVADLTYQIVVDNGPMSERSPDAEVTGVSTIHERWYLMVPGDETRAMPIWVAEQQRTQQKISTYAQSTAGGAVVANTPNLGMRHDLTIRTENQTVRTLLEKILASSETLRLVDILGDEWLVRPIDDSPSELLRIKPRSDETTGLRDFFERRVTLLEVAK